MRINSAMDDPAGLAVSEKMRSQVRGLTMASRNVQDGISFLQTAEGWLNETTSLLQRMRELAVQSSNGIYTTADRAQIQTEIAQLVDEVDRIASQAEYNGLRMLKGGFRNEKAPEAPAATKEAGANSAIRNVAPIEAGNVTHHDLANEGGGLTLHIGANMDNRETVYIGNMSAAALGLAEGEGDAKQLKLDYSTSDGANKAISQVDSAIFAVSRQRADIGAYQMRMEIAQRGIDVTAENLTAAESRVRDTDMAEEMVNYVKNKILTETSGSLLAQANMRPMVITHLVNSMK